MAADYELHSDIGQDSNLYIGTTASEVLHFVALPPESEDDQDGPTLIQASRFQPSGHDKSTEDSERPGVQQIVVLPGPARACILCNGMVSFYSLPELSPVFPNREPAGVQWVGGVDENEDLDDPEGQVVMIANSKRILQVRIGEKLKAVKNNIEYPRCLRSSRRGTIACVADRQSYALLEVEHQQKIPLFPISSASEYSIPSNDQIGSGTRASGLPPRTSSLARKDLSPGVTASHTRSTSLGNLLSSSSVRQASPRPSSRSPSALRVPELRAGVRSRSGAGSPERLSSLEQMSSSEPRSRPRSATETDPTSAAEQSVPPASVFLRPHVLSPSPNEFLLTTGTTEREPGVGLFVNLDGDVVRGTIEFSRYPVALVIDQPVPGANMPQPSGEEEGSVLALISKEASNGSDLGIESQDLSSDPALVVSSRSWLSMGSRTVGNDIVAGVHSCLSAGDLYFPYVSRTLRLVRLNRNGRTPGSISLQKEATDPRTRASLQHVEAEKELFDSHTSRSPDEIPPLEWETKRNKEEAAFAKSFASAQSRTMAWSENHVWYVVRNPLILRLEARLDEASAPHNRGSPARESVDDQKLSAVLKDIRKQEAKSEVDFMSLNYVRQKISLMLFEDLHAGKNIVQDRGDSLQRVENALIEGNIDPRVVLMLVPDLLPEVLAGPHGVWVHQGLADLVNAYRRPRLGDATDTTAEFYMMLKRYLTHWQGKRGFGSITDEQYVIDSVDAGLLKLLLCLEKMLPSGSPAASSNRLKLHDVVDHWKGDFGRAEQLLEDYQRLYVLSRLYQSRKLSKDVLRTWRRIIEGETDLGGELSGPAAEAQIQKYLTVISSPQLVEHYGIWLASRNVDAAILVFTDDSARVKFSPNRVIPLLKNKAPGAVQRYLEHLVFEKNLTHYGDDLIGYYLDSVLNVLEDDDKARDSLSQSYSTYRALQAPKPTYLNFITENAPPQPWWQSRLRLLQLLGGGSYASPSQTNKNRHLTYSIPMVLERLAPYSSYLVSESIILDARQGRHKEALRLLTHGLGDYDTALRYCYFGGPAPASSGTVDASTLPAREAQRELFTYLLQDFLQIEDVDERLERTSQLVGKFAAWFDPLEVLNSIPESWSVSVMNEFLMRTLRAIRDERNEAAVLRALSASQNLQAQAKWINVCEKLGAQLEGMSTGDDSREGGGAVVPIEGVS